MTTSARALGLSCFSFHVARRSSRVAALALGALALGGCRSGGATPEARTANVAGRSVAAGGALPFVAEVAPVRALAAQGSVLWAASARGLRRWELARGDVASFDREDGLPPGAIASVAVEGSGAVWAVTEAGVARLAAGGPKASRFETVLAEPGYTHVALGTTSTFLGGARGVVRLEPGSRKVTSVWAQGPVTALGPGSNGGICAAVKGAGVACFDEQGREVLSVESTHALANGISFVGLGHETGGTAVAAGTSADGHGRLLFLGARGPELYEGEDMPPIEAVADGPEGPLLIVGAKGVSRPYAVHKIERGQVIPAGAFRLAPAARKLEATRYIARPIAAQADFTATSAAAAQGKLYFGTDKAGVIAAADMKPLPGGELAEEERGLTVVCENPERCVLATGAPTAWSWANQRLEPLPLGTAAEHVVRVEGVWRGSEGASWALASEHGFKGFSVWRALGDLTRWEKVGRFPVALAEDEVVARFVSAPASRNVWIGLVGRSADGQETSRGVLELEPGTWRTWHHHAAVAKAAKSDALPVPDDVRAVWIAEEHGQPATWFCTRDGVFRFLQGSLRSWGENEGFESESCQGLAEGPDHAIWASTHAGLMRFDGKRWSRHAADAWPRDRENEVVAGFGVISAKAGGKGVPLPGSWVATDRGLLAARSASPAPILVDASRGLVDEQVRALADDGEGRLWALGRAGITLVDPASVFGTSPATP